MRRCLHLLGLFLLLATAVAADLYKILDGQLRVHLAHNEI
jgi:hypothetical protein